MITDNTSILFKLPGEVEVTRECDRPVKSTVFLTSILKIDCARKVIFSHLEKRDFLALRETCRLINRVVSKEINRVTYRLDLKHRKNLLHHTTRDIFTDGKSITFKLLKGQKQKNHTGHLLLNKNLKDEFSYYADLKRKPKLSHTLANIDFFKKSKKLDIPEWLSRKIHDFFIYFEGKPNILDCHGFLHFVLDAPFMMGHFNDKHLCYDQLFSAEVKSAEINDALIAGTAITIFGKNNERCHSAVYLGKGEYISKFGDSAPLMITGLDNMRKLFNAHGYIRTVKRL